MHNKDYIYVYIDIILMIQKKQLHDTVHTTCTMRILGLRPFTHSHISCELFDGCNLGCSPHPHWQVTDRKNALQKWRHFSGERVEQARNFTRYLQLLHLLHPSTEVTNIFDWAFCATVFVLLNLELETAEKPMRSFHLHFSLINVTVHTSPSSFLYNFNLILVQFPNPNTETGDFLPPCSGRSLIFWTFDDTTPPRNWVDGVLDLS